MSTRANVIIQDSTSKLIFYRHSDGYPSTTLESLRTFCQGYTEGTMRRDVMQSAGWLVVQGYAEYLKGSKPYLKPVKGGFSGWKVGSYEPTSGLHGDIEFLYVIDLEEGTIETRETLPSFWESPTLEHTFKSSQSDIVTF